MNSNWNNKTVIYRDTDVLKLKDHTGYDKDSTNRINSILDSSDDDKLDSEKIPHPLEVSQMFKIYLQLFSCLTQTQYILS